MNEFIEAVGEFKMKTQRLSNIAPVSINNNLKEKTILEVFFYFYHLILRSIKN